MESNAGMPVNHAGDEVVFMPAELPPEPPQPEPAPGGGAPVGTHAIRRKVLTGLDEQGQSVDFGGATYALIDVGMRDGTVGLACSTDGLIAVYTSHDEDCKDLSNFSPEITATARELIDSLVAVAHGMLPNQGTGWPMPRSARFWLRQNGGVTGITGSAEILTNNFLPWTRSFKLFERILKAAEPPQGSDPGSLPTPPANLRAVVLRRNALLGLSEHGQPVAPGSEVAALVDLGVNGGCITVATFRNGGVSLILYQLGQGMDLGLNASSPEIAWAVQRLARGTSALSEQLRWSERIDYPIPGEARFYRPTPQGIRSTSVPALAVRDPQIGAAEAFDAAVSLVKNHPSAFAAVSAQFPVPREFYR